MDEYVSKPVSRQALEQAMERYSHPAARRWRGEIFVELRPDPAREIAASPVTPFL